MVKIYTVQNLYSIKIAQCKICTAGQNLYSSAASLSHNLYYVKSGFLVKNCTVSRRPVSWSKFVQLASASAHCSKFAHLSRSVVLVAQKVNK